MAINKVIYGNNTLIDLTGDTAVAEDVAAGKLFHLANGTQATGTGSGGVGGVIEYSETAPTSNVLWFDTAIPIPTDAELIYISVYGNGEREFLNPSYTGFGSNSQVWIDDNYYSPTLINSYSFEGDGYHQIVIAPQNISTCSQMFKDCDDIRAVKTKNLNYHYDIYSFESMFEGCTHLEDVEHFEFEKLSYGVTTTKSMFEGCENIDYIYLRECDFSNLNNTESMFALARKLTRVDVPMRLGATDKIDSVAHMLFASHVCEFDFRFMCLTSGDTDLYAPLAFSCDYANYILDDSDFLLTLYMGCLDAQGEGYRFYDEQSYGCVANVPSGKFLYYGRIVDSCPADTVQRGNECWHSPSWYSKFFPYEV